MKPGSLIVFVKTLQSRPTNWPSLKGLSLIAHFNFQRAAGVATQNWLPGVRLPFHRNSVSWTRPEDKKPQCRSHPGDSATESLFQKRGEFCSAPLGLSTIYFRFPAAGFARLSAGVLKNRARKYRNPRFAQALFEYIFRNVGANHVFAWPFWRPEDAIIKPRATPWDIGQPLWICPERAQ